MKSYTLLFIMACCLMACGGNSSKDMTTEEPPVRTSVTITHASYGSINQEMAFTATTMYLKKSVATAPISSFIIASYVQPGMRVRVGQVLYRLESKERHAIGEDAGGGIISITAPNSGIVLDVQQVSGGYATEGTTLCTIVDAGSLVFSINIPYEQRRFSRPGTKCRLELPDGTRVTATIQSPLASMDVGSQSEQVIARARVPFLPEGMTVKAIFSIGRASSGNDMVVPKSAVQSDETLTEHWVMRLKDDTTAEKVAVEAVCSNAQEVEIRSARLTPSDRIILTGGYGLESGAKVTVKRQ